MAKKKYFTLSATALFCLFLLCVTPVVSAEITASIRVNAPEYEAGEELKIPTEIIIHVPWPGIWVDDHFYQKKFEWLLEVKDSTGKGYPPQDPEFGAVDQKPIPPVKSKVWLKGGAYEGDIKEYKVVLPNLRDYYYIDGGGGGVFSIQFVSSITVYGTNELAPGNLEEKTVRSNIENFIVFEVMELDIDINPNPMFLSRLPNWATCYIYFPTDSEFGPSNVDMATVDLWLINPDSGAKEFITTADWGDIQGDQMMIKFPGPDIRQLLELYPYTVDLEVTGSLSEYTKFSGQDTIKVKN